MTKWVYDMYRDGENIINHYNGWLVAKGFWKGPGEDFQEYALSEKDKTEI